MQENLSKRILRLINPLINNHVVIIICDVNFFLINTKTTELKLLFINNVDQCNFFVILLRPFQSYFLKSPHETGGRRLIPINTKLVNTCNLAPFYLYCVIHPSTHSVHLPLIILLTFSFRNKLFFVHYCKFQFLYF